MPNEWIEQVLPKRQHAVASQLPPSREYTAVGLTSDLAVRCRAYVATMPSAIQGVQKKLSYIFQIRENQKDLWSVENCQHLVKDRWRDEDKHLLSLPGVVFTSMLNAALSVSRFLKKKNEPMTAGQHPNFLVSGEEKINFEKIPKFF